LRATSLKPLVVIASLAPVAYLAWGAASGGLGANPIETITRETGTWTLRFLVITLAVTPLRRLTAWNDAIKFRRMGGRAWRRLHRLAYASAVVGVVHYWWLVKLDTRRPRNYAVTVAVLLGARLFTFLRPRLARRFGT